MQVLPKSAEASIYTLSRPMGSKTLNLSPDNAARIAFMGMYASGPFTRVAFYLQRGDLCLAHSRAPVDAGTAIHTISGEGRYVNNPYWRLA